VLQATGSLELKIGPYPLDWTTGTAVAGAEMRVSEAGFFGLYESDTAIAPFWKSSSVLPRLTALPQGTSIYSPSGEYRLILESDSNLKLYSASNKTVWASGVRTLTTAVYALFVQRNGDFTVVDNSTLSANGQCEDNSCVEAWSAGTGNASVPDMYAQLAVQDNGQACVYRSDALFKKLKCFPEEPPGTMVVIHIDNIMMYLLDVCIQTYAILMCLKRVCLYDYTMTCRTCRRVIQSIKLVRNVLSAVVLIMCTCFTALTICCACFEEANSCMCISTC
jgi:hypothetical protein